MAIVATSVVVPTAVAGPDQALASGVLMVDANRDGVVTAAGSAGEVDKPLPGVAVTLKGSIPDHPGWTTQTAADGTWSFPADDDYSASPPPFTVTIDVAGVAGDVYATAARGAGNAFTPVPDRPQQAVSAPFAADAAPTVLNGLVYPVWALDLGLVNDSAGYDGKAIYTGSAPFDAADDDGQDSSAANDRVRSGDLVAYKWSLTAAHDVAVGDSFPNATFEQTLTLDDGAKVNFARIPAVCEPGSITAFPSGQTVQPMTDPPAGTTSVVLTCNLGRMGEDRAALLPDTSAWVSPNSVSGAEFSTSARAYATDDDGVAVARPSNQVDAGPFTITSAPRFDLKKWEFRQAYQETATFGGVPNTPVMNVVSVITISTDRKVGTEAFRQPITIDEEFWAEYTTAAGQNGLPGTVVPDLQYQLRWCVPTTNPGGVAVYGYPHASGAWPEEQSVVNSGTCTITRDDPSDLTSGYSLTFDGIDTSGTRYPTQSAGGADLSAGPYYLASYTVTIQVPLSELDRAQGAPDDGAGELSFFNRVGGFDPAGMSGASNFGAGVEPGYCEPGTADTAATGCARMENGVRSNNVAGPITPSIKPGGWSKFILDNASAWTSGETAPEGVAISHDGGALTQPGQTHGSRMVLENSGRLTWSNVQQCDVFDNSVARLAPLKQMVLSGADTLPDDLYSYVLRYGASVAQNKTFNENFIVEYAHVDLSPDNPMTGDFHAATNRWEGDWTTQQAASCDDVPEAEWQTDPNAVPGGIDEVNIVRMRTQDGYEVEPGTNMRWWLAMEQRDTFYGGPHDGKHIPAGTVFANYGRHRTDQWFPSWNDASYIPGAGTTGGTYRTGESGSQQGDRWTVTRGTMSLQKRTIRADVDGVWSSGAADFGITGAAVAGRPMVWEIVSSLTADSEEPGAVSNVVITDTLPKHTTYNEAATAALEGGTPASSYTVNPDGTTTLVWSLGTLTPNQPIPPLRVVTDTDPLAPSNTALVNTATITADGIVPVRAHTDDHTVRLEQSDEVQLKKSVDQPLDLQDQEQSYTLQVKNFSETQSILAPTVIDVLSYVGDRTSNANVNRAPGSDYAGGNQLAGPPEAFTFDGQTPLGGTFYYTTVPAADVPQSVNDDTDPSIWSTDFTPDATAFKFIADSPLGTTHTGSASGLTIKYTTEQSGNAAGDLYSNRFTAFSDSLKNENRYQLLASNQTTVRVLGFSLGDFIWIETDSDGKYTAGVDTPAPAGVEVQVFNATDDSQVATTSTDEHGRWVVNDLPQGDYYAVIPASQFAPGAPLAGLQVYPDANGDANDDTNEDAGHDGLPADGGGVRTTTITLDATVAGDGSISGNEPLGDNVGNVKLSPLTTDDFSNLTLDVALYSVPPTPGYEFTKTADPVSGTAVTPGKTVAYTVTGTNTGGTPLDVVVGDDLSGVLAHADLVDGSLSASIEGVEGVAAPTVEGTALSWSGTLEPGQSVVITYTVELHDDAWGVTIHNLASSSATPPAGEVITPPDVETEHPTPKAPGYEFTKTADPVSGTAVAPGDTVAYTVTGKNTGGTPLDVTITDDLSGVLAHAVLDPVAIVDDLAEVPAPTVEGTTLSWSGTLAPGQSVRITYVVQVNADAWGVRIHNLATSTATPPVGPVIVPPQVETEHPTPAYAFAKEADPVSGAAVDPGQEITYTLTGSNTGQTVLDPVTITDDLTDVLAHADLVDGSLSAVIDGVAEVPAPVVDGATLSWSGRLEPGQVVAVTYTVRVHADAEGVVLRNHAASSATPPDGLSPLTPPDVETFHPTPGYTLVKTADPVSGTPVSVGGQVTYTLTGTNHGATVLDPVQITDNLAEVLAHADLVDGSLTAVIDGVEAPPAPVLDGVKLSWTGRLDPGQQVRVTYTVQVKEGAEGATLHNVAESVAVPPTGTPIMPPKQETEHPVPGYTFAKTSNPGDGATLAPGQKVTYTLTGVNTGASRLDRVTITDDLARVLTHAGLDGEPVATITGRGGATRTADAPTVQDTTLAWTGALEVGETVTVTYTVTIDTDCPDTTLVNVAVSSATPPGTDPLTPPKDDTTHTVVVPDEPAPSTPEKPSGPSWLPRTGAEIGASLAVIVLLVGAGALLVTATRARGRHQ